MISFQNLVMMPSAVLRRIICLWTFLAISSLECAQMDECFTDIWHRRLCCFERGVQPCFDEEFTRERCRCDSKMESFPLPELIRAMQETALAGFNTMPRQHIFALLNRNLGLNGTWVEVGVQRGEFSIGLLELMHGTDRYGSVNAFYLVDPWREQSLYDDDANVPNKDQFRNMATVMEQAVSFWNKVRFVQLGSTEAARLFDAESVDFIYLDGRHEYCGVVDDLLAWWPKLKIGGIMGGDDYGWSTMWVQCQNGSRIEGGVKRAVKAILEPLTPVHDIGHGGQWLAQKLRPASADFFNRRA
eukprot:TRINITY_DN24279_c1_g3_i1.p1 TRINITY_DN24279_c1_g3~~TRINITY_DN24279_c1_g3_i1.p1  ORF type:complete len:301 (-),score=31.63 TRINITY_DN24279_c1_g3_i1:59-961(-)